MKPGSVKHKIDPSDKGLRQHFLKLGLTKGHVYGKTSSKDRVNTSSTKKMKSSSSIKNFGGSIGHNPISKVRVSSGGRTKPGASKYPDKKLKYLLSDNDKYKRKTGGGSHSRNQIYTVPTGSQTGRSYNKSNTRDYSPHTVNKSPKNPVKKSRNKRLVGSQTHVTTKRKTSNKKSSRDQEGYNTSKFQDWQNQLKISQNRHQFNALSPKTMKNIMKNSSSGISGFEKYQRMTNPSKYSDARTSNDKKMTSYLHSLASNDSRSKEDLRFVPVENISLFDESSAPHSSRNPRSSSGVKSQKTTNFGPSLHKISFIRNFRIIRIFKKWASYWRRQKYLLKRKQLAEKLPWGKPFFVPFIHSAIEPLKPNTIKNKNIYSKKNNGHQGFIIQWGNKQKQTISRIGKKFFKVIGAIDKLWKAKTLMLKQTRKYKEEKEAAVDLIDRALSFLLISSVYSIRDLIRNEQNILYCLIVTNKKSQNQLKFGFELEFDHNGNIVPNPPFNDYTIHIMNLYESIRKTITTEKIVEEFLYDIVTFSKNELDKKGGYWISPIDYVKRRSFWKEEKDSLEKAIGNNIKRANDYLYQFRSFSGIHDLIKDTESHFQTLKKCQFERMKQILTKIEGYHKNIENIPNLPISIDWIMLNMLGFKQSFRIKNYSGISNSPNSLLNDLNDIMIKFLQNESSSLYSELVNYIQIFSAESPELTQFIEQSNAFKKLKNEFPSLEKKVENLENVASLFDHSILAQVHSNSDNYSNIGPNSYKSKSVVVSESIVEVRKWLQLLPELFIKVKSDLDVGRENLATKVLETSQTLLQMIKSFEEAYVDNFHRRSSTKKAKDTLSKVKAKSKTFEDIQKKSDLFKSSLEFLKSEGDRRVTHMYPDLEKYECHVEIQRLNRMHDSTIKAWEYISIWQEQMDNISQSGIGIIGSMQEMIDK